MSCLLSTRDRTPTPSEIQGANWAANALRKVSGLEIVATAAPTENRTLGSGGSATGGLVGRRVLWTLLFLWFHRRSDPRRRRRPGDPPEQPEPARQRRREQQ